MGIVKEAEFEVREACIFALGRLHTVLSKYGDHLPLYRQEDIAARYGVVLRRSTLCDWIAAAADLAEPLYERMCALVRGSPVADVGPEPRRPRLPRQRIQ